MAAVPSLTRSERLAKAEASHTHTGKASAVLRQVAHSITSSPIVTRSSQRNALRACNAAKSVDLTVMPAQLLNVTNSGSAFGPSLEVETFRSGSVNLLAAQSNAGQLQFNAGQLQSTVNAEASCKQVAHDSLHTCKAVADRQTADASKCFAAVKTVSSITTKQKVATQCVSKITSVNAAASRAAEANLRHSAKLANARAAATSQAQPQVTGPCTRAMVSMSARNVVQSRGPVKMQETHR